MTCTYCHRQIYPDTYGWGYDEEDNVFHVECFEMFEGVTLYV